MSITREELDFTLQVLEAVARTFDDQADKQLTGRQAAFLVRWSGACAVEAIEEAA